MAVKTASEMTYIVSSGALNSTPTNQLVSVSICAVCSVDELKLLLTDDTKLQHLLAPRVDEVNEVQQKVVLFLEKFASQCLPTPVLCRPP